MRHRLLALLATLACLTAFSAVAATPAHATGDGYVPIGDSYAAVYPQLLGGGADPALVLLEGGTTRTLKTAVADWDGWGKATQVTLTVGGNDAGFGLLAGCLSDDCPTAAKIAKGIASVPSGLSALLTTIRKQAPKATVYVTGYPLLFQPKVTVKGLKVSVSCQGLPGFDPKDMVALDAAAVALNAAIAATVKTADAKLSGPKIVYVDVAGAFAGHGVCRSGSWITGLDSPVPLHLTDAGHAAYAGAIRARGFKAVGS